MKKTFTLLMMIVCLNASAQTVTWSPALNIASNTYGNLHPRMVMDRSGNPLVIWGRMSDESVLFSRWTGTAFTTPVKLNPAWLTIATASWMGPDIASKGDTVFIVIKKTPEGIDTNYVYTMRSFNGGVSFSSPVRVDFIADSISRFPAVAVDASGNPLVAFMKFNSSFLDSRWVVAKSSDYGNTFSTDVIASGWSGANAEVCDCCPGGIVSSGNTTAMLYRDNLSNIRDMWTGISTNGGVAFNNGFSVDNTNWMIMACPSSGPDGIIIGDSLYTVFMSGGTGSNRTYLSRSSISNLSANSVTLLTGSITGLSMQNYPRIDRFGNAVAIVWQQMVSGNAQLPILFTNNIANGFPAAYDTVDLSNITNTDVALSNGSIFVVWQDDNSGTVKYRKGTFTPVNTSVNEINENHFSVFPNPTSGFISIRSDNAEIVKAASIKDLVGKTILTTDKTEIDLSQLAAGMYFLELTISERRYVTRILRK